MAAARGSEFDYRKIQAQIRKEFNAPGVSDELMKLMAVRESRLIRSFRPEVVTFAPDSDDGLAPLPGSVLMITARKGNPIFAGLRKAYRAGDTEALSALGKELVAVVQKRKVATVAKVVSLISRAPSLFDLRYRTTTLAANISLVGGVEIGTISIPYNGGPIRDSEFSIAEYYKSNTERDWDVLLVKRPPKLSDLEKRVLKAVPASQDLLHLGAGACCPGYTVVIVLIFVAVTVAGKTCLPFRDRLAEVELPPATIKKLGPAATARQLLSMRRELFAKFGA